MPNKVADKGYARSFIITTHYAFTICSGPPTQTLSPFPRVITQYEKSPPSLFRQQLNRMLAIFAVMIFVPICSVWLRTYFYMGVIRKYIRTGIPLLSIGNAEISIYLIIYSHNVRGNQYYNDILHRGSFRCNFDF